MKRSSAVLAFVAAPGVVKAAAPNGVATDFGLQLTEFEGRVAPIIDQRCCGCAVHGRGGRAEVALS